MTKIKIFAPVALVFFLSGCGMLFWSETDAYKGGHWWGESLFLEIALRHERKTPWNPLNQNVLSRNYRTRFIVHMMEGRAVKQSVPLAVFEGWIPRHGLQLSGLRRDAPKSDIPGESVGEFLAVMMIGEGDAFGAGLKHVTIFRFQPVEGFIAQTGKAMNMHPKDHLLAALPSPDGRYLALLTTKATMENRTGRAEIHMHRLRPADAKPVLLNRIPLKWSGAPGLPNMSWARDSSRLFIQRMTDMLEVTPRAKAPRRASRFPVCMTVTLGGTNISDAGLFFYRDRGQIRVRKEAGWIARDKIPMISDFAKIGAGCP